MKIKDLDEKLNRIEYLLEYLSREIETIKTIIGLTEDQNILNPLQSTIKIHKIATEEYRRIIAYEKLIRSEKIDKISQEILRILAYIGPMNISEITKELRRRRGRASRRTVSQRLKNLEEKGLVTLNKKGKEKRYRYKGN